MSTTPSPAPPKSAPKGKIILPDLDEIEEFERSKGSVDIDDTGIEVQMISKGYGSPENYLIDLACLFVAFIVPYGVMRYLYYWSASNSVMLAITVTFLVFASLYRRLFASVDPQTVDIYEDIFTGRLLAYKYGFYVVSPKEVYRETRNIVDDSFVIDTEHNDDDSKLTAAVVETNDPFRVSFPYKIIGRPIATEEGIRNSLRYSPAIRNEMIRLMANSRIAIIGGKYSYLFILDNLGDIGLWVRRIFGGDGMLSEFERRIGYSLTLRLKDPVCNDPMALKLLADKLKGEQVASIARKLRDESGMSPDKAGAIAAAIVTPESANLVQEEVDIKGGKNTGVVVGGNAAFVANSGGRQQPNQPGRKGRNRGRRP